MIEMDFPFVEGTYRSACTAVYCQVLARVCPDSDPANAKCIIYTYLCWLTVMIVMLVHTKLRQTVLTVEGISTCEPTSVWRSEILRRSFDTSGQECVCWAPIPRSLAFSKPECGYEMSVLYQREQTNTHIVLQGSDSERGGRWWCDHISVLRTVH